MFIIYKRKGLTMKKSKADTAETRRTIVATASEMFVRDGIAETGVSDVMSEAGLTVGGFYRHFDSKDHLLAEATKSAFDRLLDGIELATSLRAMVTLYLHSGSSCPLANLGPELRRASPSVRKVAKGGYHRFVGIIAARLEALGAPGATTTATSMVATMTGALMLSQLTGDHTILEKAEKTLASHFEGPRRRTRG